MAAGPQLGGNCAQRRCDFLRLLAALHRAHPLDDHILLVDLAHQLLRLAVVQTGESIQVGFDHGAEHFPVFKTVLAGDDVLRFLQRQRAAACGLVVGAAGQKLAYAGVDLGIALLVGFAQIFGLVFELQEIGTGGVVAWAWRTTPFALRPRSAPVRA